MIGNQKAQVITVDGEAFPTGSTLHIFGKSYTTSENFRFEVDVSQDIANLKEGFYPLYVQAATGERSVTTGIHILSFPPPKP